MNHVWTKIFLLALVPTSIFGFFLRTEQLRIQRGRSLLAVDGASREGRISLPESGPEIALWYKIYRPMALTSRTGAPIVLLHGGPGIPSDYLQPLGTAIDHRAAVFYDQLGCGRSDSPEDASMYGVDQSISNLRFFLQKLDIHRYHLLGQSWGGMLAFEHTITSGDEILSLTLANSPACVATVEKEASRLIEECTAERGGDANAGYELFEERHNSGAPPRHWALEEAYKRVGTLFRGTDAIQGWEAAADCIASFPKNVPVLCIRGERDFVTEACVAPWAGLPRVQMRTIPGCGHMSSLQQPRLFVDMVESFIGEYD